MHGKIIKTTLRSYVLITFLLVPCALYSMNKKSDIQPLKEDERRVLELLIRPSTCIDLVYPNRPLKDLISSNYIAKNNTIVHHCGTWYDPSSKNADTLTCKIEESEQESFSCRYVQYHKTTFAITKKMNDKCHVSIFDTQTNTTIVDNITSEPFATFEPFTKKIVLTNQKKLIALGNENKIINTYVTTIIGRSFLANSGNLYATDIDNRVKIGFIDNLEVSGYTKPLGLIQYIAATKQSFFVKHKQNGREKTTRITPINSFLACIFSTVGHPTNTNQLHILPKELRDNIAGILFAIGGMFQIEEAQYSSPLQDLYNGNCHRHTNFIIKNTRHDPLTIEYRFEVLDTYGRTLYAIDHHSKDFYTLLSTNKKSFLYYSLVENGISKRYDLIDKTSEKNYKWYTTQATPEQKKLLQKISSPQPHAQAFTRNDKNIYATLPASVQERFNHFIKK